MSNTYFSHKGLLIKKSKFYPEQQINHGAIHWRVTSLITRAPLSMRNNMECGEQMFAVANFSRSRGGLRIDFDQIARIDLQIKRYLRPLNCVLLCSPRIWFVRAQSACKKVHPTRTQPGNYKQLIKRPAFWHLTSISRKVNTNENWIIFNEHLSFLFLCFLHFADANGFGGMRVFRSRSGTQFVFLIRRTRGERCIAGKAVCSLDAKANGEKHRCLLFAFSFLLRAACFHLFGCAHSRSLFS